MTLVQEDVSPFLVTLSMLDEHKKLLADLEERYRAHAGTLARKLRRKVSVAHARSKGAHFLGKSIRAAVNNHAQSTAVLLSHSYSAGQHAGRLHARRELAALGLDVPSVSLPESTPYLDSVKADLARAADDSLGTLASEGIPADVLQRGVGDLKNRLQVASTVLTNRGYTDAAQAVYRAAQAKNLVQLDKVWVTNFTPTTCPICASLHGTAIPMGMEFPDHDGEGGRHVSVYRDLQGPPRHPNCRCRVVPRIANTGNLLSLSHISEEARVISGMREFASDWVSLASVSVGEKTGGYFRSAGGHRVHVAPYHRRQDSAHQLLAHATRPSGVLNTDFSNLTPANQEIIDSELAKVGTSIPKMADHITSFGKGFIENGLGPGWYPQAHQDITKLANETGHTVEQASGVMAALSPQTPWDRNLIKARLVLEHHREYADLSPEDAAVRFGLGLNTDTEKAIRIARGEAPGDVLAGPKVRSFYNNLLAPDQTSSVTVNGWMSKALVHTSSLDEKAAVRFLNLRRVKVTGGQGGVGYVAIAEATRIAAARNGVSPDAMQAAYWVAARGGRSD